MASNGIHGNATQGNGIQTRIGPALVDFSQDGTFPEEEAIISANIEDSALPGALRALNEAKTALESEIRSISQETIPGVESWMATTKAIQEDIERLRRFATEVVRDAEADEDKQETLEDHQAHVDFLEKEVSFNEQLEEALRYMQEVNTQLDEGRRLAQGKDILTAQEILEGAWNVMDKIPVDRFARAIRLLDDECFELKSFIYEQLTAVWKFLVYWDNPGLQSLTIRDKNDEWATDMPTTIICWQAFKKLDDTVKGFWDEFDDCILKPRTNIYKRPLLSINVQGNTISVGPEQADTSIKSLFRDLEIVVRFLVDFLPEEFIQKLSHMMMPSVFTRIKEQWLDTAVPSSLADMVAYQKSLVQVNDFATNLESLNWPTAASFQDWCSDTHKIWLTKRKETCLDWTRHHLELGLGTPVFAERFETKMVAREEGDEIAKTGTAAVADWDAGWDDDTTEDAEESEEPLPSGMSRASIEEERRASETHTPQLSTIDSSPAVSPTQATNDDDDDAADAWGWGDDDITEQSAPEPEPEPQAASLQMNRSPVLREMTLTESYWTSSIPKPLFNSIVKIYEDGATLTKPESQHIPVAPAALGLLSFPTQVLAMYRAVSPYYYAKDPAGNMYAYNDSIWLCGKLTEFAVKWKSRADIPQRPRDSVQLDPQIEKLKTFGRHAYTHELTTQRTIINDFLGGAQNFFQEGASKEELEEAIDNVIAHIRRTSALWKGILPLSAWASAIGALVNAVAKKIIADVFDRDGLGADETTNITELITKVSSLNDLFVFEPAAPNGRKNSSPSKSRKPSLDGAMPVGPTLTHRFADKWMKMCMLGEVLDANLVKIEDLWFRDELSLDFNRDEVVDLIKMCFEDNPQARALCRKIQQGPIRGPDEEE